MYAKMITDQLFKKLDTLEFGQLKVVTPDGQERVFAGGKEGDAATLQLKDWNVIPNMIRKGDIGFAEDYKSGLWETDNLVGLTTLGLINKKALDPLVMGSKFSQMMASLSYLLKLNTVKGSRKNIHAHYDLGNDFYSLWLDKTMTYSSAIFENSTDSLAQGQLNKYDRLLECMNKKSGSVLEVGCGWGGFADRATERGDYDLKAITVSKQQHDFAKLRMGKRAKIALEDYRHQKGKYDSIISIEMFEAVGEAFWPTYFNKIGSLLKKDGRAVIQTITMNDNDFEQYRKGGDFIRSYIFPGGMLPSPTRFKQECEKAGLKTQNMYSFGYDYARTLQEWLNNFDDKRHIIKAMGFDDSFIRLWRFYLAGCIAGFRSGRTDVMQIEVSHA